MEDGRYRLEIVMSDGQEYEFHFLLATNLAARPRHVRSVLGSILDPVISEEEIGLALWLATARADEETLDSDIEPESRPVARQRYVTYLAAADLLRRRLIELASGPSEKERKMGDASSRVAYDLTVLRSLLDEVEKEQKRWESALFGSTKLLGAVRGNRTDIYPLDGRVW